MKVIFLDMDGVMNTGGSDEAGVNPRLAKIFQDMLSKTDAKVVISSSWKEHPALLNVIKNSVCDFYDKTPFLPNLAHSSTERRGGEIQAWLDEHPEVENYAIIDDAGSDYIYRNQLENFFQTQGSIGLTQETADKVIEHLK